MHTLWKTENTKTTTATTKPKLLWSTELNRWDAKQCTFYISFLYKIWMRAGFFLRRLLCFPFWIFPWQMLIIFLEKTSCNRRIWGWRWGSYCLHLTWMARHCGHHPETKEGIWRGGGGRYCLHLIWRARHCSHHSETKEGIWGWRVGQLLLKLGYCINLDLNPQPLYTSPAHTSKAESSTGPGLSEDPHSRLELCFKKGIWWSYAWYPSCPKCYT